METTQKKQWWHRLGAVLFSILLMIALAAGLHCGKAYATEGTQSSQKNLISQTSRKNQISQASRRNLISQASRRNLTSQSSRKNLISQSSQPSRITGLQE